MTTNTTVSYSVPARLATAVMMLGKTEAGSGNNVEALHSILLYEYALFMFITLINMIKQILL